METDLTTLQTVTVLADQLARGEIAYLPFSGRFHSQQISESQLSCFKIITLTIRLTLVRELIQKVGSMP